MALKRLCNRSLVSSAANFSPFVHLEELNLAHNLLTDITLLGLENLPNLRVLDLSFNSLQNTLPQIAEFLDKMKNLECIALRNNPTMKSENDRKKLIGLMVTMREITCVLQVLDTFISIDERIEAWKAAGGNPNEAELIRYKAVMFQRLPRDSDPSLITSLDLNDSGFQKIDVFKFINLEFLLLRNNKLTTVTNTGIHQLKKLKVKIRTSFHKLIFQKKKKVLDLRDNQLSKLDEIVDLIHQLPELQTLGLSGNKLDKNWRHKVLIDLPELHQRHCSLRMIDDEEITVDEIVEAWKASKQDIRDAKNFRFHVLILFRIPKDTDPLTLTELDFSNSGLESVDLFKYTSLTKLSLSKNELKELKETHLNLLTNLQALDLSTNKLKDLDDVEDTLKALPKLKTLFLTNNPIFPTNDKENRIKLLAKLLQNGNPVFFPLKYLDGEKITVKEKCEALKKVKGQTLEQIEDIRLQLVIEEQKDLSPEASFVNLSNYEFSFIRNIHLSLPNVTHLDVSHNNLKTLDLETLKQLPHLIFLDLRFNDFPKLKDVLDILVAYSNSNLEQIYLEHVTKTRETAVPREYAFQVCKAMRYLHSVDGIKNPFGVPVERRKKNVVASTNNNNNNIIDNDNSSTKSNLKRVEAFRVRSEMKVNSTNSQSQLPFLPPVNPLLYSTEFLDDQTFYHNVSPNINSQETQFLYKGQIENE